MFAGGIAAGPFLTDQASVLVERLAPMLGISVPRFVANRRPAPLPVRPMSPQAEVVALAPTPAAEPEPSPAPAPALAAGEPKAPAAEGRGEPTAVVAKPARSAVDKKAAPKAVPAVAQRRAAVATPARAEVAVAEAPAAHPQHAKGAVKTTSSASTPTRKSSGSEDPFASADERAPNAAAPSGKSKPAPSESTARAKSEPAPKPAASKSHDSLDSLMADGVADSKGKKRESKDLDALLQDVQKSKPESPPKREAPPPAASLSPSDISRVMAGVKTRGNECAQRLGQKGIAELKITVGKDGHVTDVHVGGKVADTPLAACVEKAARAATFPPSSGLRFDYRIDCR